MCFKSHKPKRVSKIHYCNKFKKLNNIIKNEEHICGFKNCKNFGLKLSQIFDRLEVPTQRYRTCYFKEQKPH